LDLYFKSRQFIIYKWCIIIFIFKCWDPNTCHTKNSSFYCFINCFIKNI